MKKIFEKLIIKMMFAHHQMHVQIWTHCPLCSETYV